MTNPLTGKPGYVFPDPYPPGATDKQLDFFTEQFRIPFPRDLREWLRITNGAAGFFGVAPVHPARDIGQVWKLRPEWLEKRWISSAPRESRCKERVHGLRRADSLL